MPEVLIKPCNHTGSINNDFVGMRFITQNGKPAVEAIFPLGYHYTSIGEDGFPMHSEKKENQDVLKKELYELLALIRMHTRSSDGKLEGINKNNYDFPFDAYITIIKAFMQYGYYIENEVQYKTASIGKINWKRTISKVKPIIQDDNAIYTDFIVRQTEKKTDRLITLIHEWCVYEAFIKLGWIFTNFCPHKPQLEIGKDKKERDYFIYVIEESLRTTFNDRNKLLFKAMIQILKNAQTEKMNAFFYGTTHFNTVWEYLINLTFGINDKEKKEYFPPADWHFVDAISHTRGNKLLPDTILLHNNEVFVLDAKYYSFIVNFSVPSAADINKQIAYGRYAYEDRTKRKAEVYNAFIIPYDFSRNPHKLSVETGEHYICIGYAALTDDSNNPKGKETYDKVLGILVDTKWLMQNAGKVKKADLANFIRTKRKELI